MVVEAWTKFASIQLIIPVVQESNHAVRHLCLPFVATVAEKAFSTALNAFFEDALCWVTEAIYM